LYTVRRQAVAQLTKQLDSELAAAAVIGADLVTGSPFRARALRRRRAPLPRAGDFDISGAVWAEVPWLPDASPDLLVKIANGEPRVEALRRATAAALRTVEAGDLAAGASEIADVAADLSAAGDKLGRELRRRSVVDLAAPTGLATGSVLIAGTFAPPLAIAGLLAGAGAALPAIRARVAQRETAAYAFWMARPRRRDARGRR